MKILKLCNVLPFVLFVSSLLFSFSCSEGSENVSTEIEAPQKPINPTNPAIGEGEKITLYYSDDKGKTVTAQYVGVRIGEYLWMDQNFSHSNPYRYAQYSEWESIGKEGLIAEEDEPQNAINQHLLNKYMGCIFIDNSHFQVDMNVFTLHYGKHYCRKGVEYMTNYGRMYEGAGKLYTAWSLPTVNDFKQLFAMCNVRDESGILDIVDVKTDLAPLHGTNPVAINFGTPPYWVYWFERNTNRYKFNLMPSGARLNGDGIWYNGAGPVGGGWEGKKGDVYHLFYTAYFPTKDNKTIMIHDFLTVGAKSWHWLPVRWCRKLTDEELGYKLYINNEKTDIKKLTPTETVPSGYKELPNGYLRGFYVQYVLNKKTPEKTIKEIVSMAEKTEKFHNS